MPEVRQLGSALALCVAGYPMTRGFIRLGRARERVEFSDAPFGGGGQVGLDDGESGETAEGAPAASCTSPNRGPVTSNNTLILAE
jgi:hypothetical protein